MNYYGASNNAYQTTDYNQFSSAPAPAAQQIQPRESMRVTVKKVTMGNGDTYEGDIVKNRFNGHGIYYYRMVISMRVILLIMSNKERVS